MLRADILSDNVRRGIRQLLLNSPCPPPLPRPYSRLPPSGPRVCVLIPCIPCFQPVLSASRDWTIAPKPKPGRKPKNDPSRLKDDNEVCYCSSHPFALFNIAHSSAIKLGVFRIGKRSKRSYYVLTFTSRAAQRAFRERKQSQLTELQARVESYQQGEIERSVAFQNVAKRLKEENDALRHENQLLREKISRMEDQDPAQCRDRRQQCPHVMSSAMTVLNKRVKLGVDASNTDQLANPAYVPLIPSMSSSQGSKCLSKSVYAPANYHSEKDQDQRSTHILDFTTVRADIESNESSSPFGSCGLCNEVIPCLCREIVAENPPTEHSVRVSTGEMLQTSILDNLPPYQPAVPLPRKHGTLTGSIFPVVPVPSLGERCTGDPTNCPACVDDAFGKAFCSAICRSVASPCVDCPFNQGKRNVLNDSGDSECRNVYASTDHARLSIGAGPKTIPTNEAWKTIKEHPNVSFADLNLLAEVVARRSKCTGPTVVISPALGEATPERVGSPEANAQPYSIQELFLSTTETRNPTHTSDRTSSQQDIVVGCSNKGVREVYTDGVRDALYLLDNTFS